MSFPSSDHDSVSPIAKYSPQAPGSAPPSQPFTLRFWIFVIVLAILTSCVGAGATFQLYFDYGIPSLIQREDMLWKQYDQAAHQDKPAIRREYERARQEYNQATNQKLRNTDVVLFLICATLACNGFFVYVFRKHPSRRESS